MLNLLMKEGLKTAYERAGQAFVGQLAQKFVVLNMGTSRPWSGGGGRVREGVDRDHRCTVVKNPGGDLGFFGKFF
jgi:hypothetical protein